MSHIHIPDGVLPLWLWASGWIVALVLVGVAGRLAERHEMRRKVPLLGVLAALMLVAMSSEIVPLAYHINLAVVAGVLLGPALAVIAAFIVEVVLAMLGHGGVTVLGLNTVVLSLEMVAGWALFRLLVGLLTRRRAGLAAGVATVLALAISTTAMVGVVWMGSATGATEIGEATVGPGLSVARFAAVVYTLGPIGWLIEALVTAGILGYVARVRPTLVFAGALRETTRHLPGDEAGGL
ncbi:MAG: energy-coupling factor ABC transporter permease [Actinomycetota bacterium]|nr:energy-coupling factor ABC transporter permease [Actinomycetota bacterium]